MVMTQAPARPGAPVDALDLLGEKGSAERALTAALACFQEQVQAVPSLDLAAVVEAARPAFSRGLAFTAQQVAIHGRHKLRVTVMHSSGAEVCSEEWADAVEDPLQAAGWMLAMLLGIPLAREAQPLEPDSEAVVDLANAGQKPMSAEADAGSAVAMAGSDPAGAPSDPAAVGSAVAAERAVKPADAELPFEEPADVELPREEPVEEDPADAGLPRAAAAGEEPAGMEPSDPDLRPLAAAAIEALHQRILALPAAVRRELTAAFREHFQVPRSARSISDRISQQRHGAFIERFLEEAQGGELEAA